MKVLLTGAAGFVGAHLLAALRERGADLVATDLVATDLVTTEAAAGPGLRALDVTDREAVRDLMAAVRPEALLHAAALTPGPDVPFPARVAAVNAHGTFTVFAAARPFATRALLVSSMAVFGGAQAPEHPAERLGEDAPPSPASVYGASKLAAENIALRSGLPTSVVRLAAVYGPGERPRDTRPRTSLVHRLLAARSASPAPDITLDLIHAEDAAAGVAALLLGPEPATGLYHLGGGEPVRWTRLLRAVRAAGHDLADGTEVAVTAADSRPVLDTGRIAAATGVRPRTIEDGVRSLLAAR